MKSVISSLAILLCLCYGQTIVAAQQVRVVSFDLSTVKSTPKEVATEISVSRPDVILLQGVRSWDFCQSLAKSLQPEEYQVLVCSAFEGSDGPLRRQVAILSRHRALYAWHERGGTNSSAAGFAFAVLQVGPKKLGVFSMQIGRSKDAELVAHKIIEQVGTASKWGGNRPDAYFTGGSTLLGPRFVPHQEVKRSFRRAGFGQSPQPGPARIAFARPAWLAVPLKEGELIETADRLMFATAINLSAKPKPKNAAGPVAGNSKKPASTPVEAFLPSTLAGATTPPTAAAGEREGDGLIPNVSGPAWPNGAAPMEDGWKRVSAYAWPFGAGFVAICLLILLFGRGRKRHSAMTSTSLIVPSVPSTGEHRLLYWLKQEFVRRLVKDRSELIVAQDEAVRDMTRAGERLARIEERIEMQNQMYLRRIEELTRELGAAREESRELIRLRIAQVRQEMEEAREKAMAGW